MAALQCEICGGKLLAQPSGMYECEFCGIQYDTAWAKEKIQEIKGTVKVEGIVEVTGTVKLDGPVKVEGNVSVGSLLKRATLSLEDGEWSSANEYYNKVLDIDPECADAYVGKLMVDWQIRKQDELEQQTEPFETNSNYLKAMRFASETLKLTLSQYAEYSKQKREKYGAFLKVAEIKNNVLIQYRGKEESLFIPSFITSIGTEAFNECTSLRYVTIPDSVTSIGNYAFSNCESLISINIPNSVTSIGDYAFSCCKSLISIDIPNSVTSIGVCAFDYCDALTDIVVSPDNKCFRIVNRCLIDISKKEVVFAFADAVIPDDGSVASIGAGAFSNCKSLTSISIPHGVISIGSAAFLECDALVSITIPDSVTSIGRLAFRNCLSLKSITIPNSVVSIGNMAFPPRNCVIETSEGSYAATWATEKGLHWKDFEAEHIARQKREEEERIALQKREQAQQIAALRRNTGLCQHCGGELKGLFSKKCVSCGRPKDY